MSDYLLAQAEEPVEVVWTGDLWRQFDERRPAPPLSKAEWAGPKDRHWRERYARRFVAGLCRDCPNARGLHSVRCYGCRRKQEARKQAHLLKADRCA